MNGGTLQKQIYGGGEFITLTNVNSNSLTINIFVTNSKAFTIASAAPFSIS